MTLIEFYGGPADGRSMSVAFFEACMPPDPVQVSGCGLDDVYRLRSWEGFRHPERGTVITRICYDYAR